MLTSSATPTQPPISNLQSPYLFAFHACDTTTYDCRDPRNHRVYLAQSDDGANWNLVPGWEPHQGSVPDVIRRGDTLYIYTPGQVRRYRFSPGLSGANVTGTWEDPVQVTLTDAEANGMFVDPSPFVDDQGRLVLFYLLGAIGQDPAGCAPGETTCAKHFHSAVEVEGSDGTAFVAQPGDRVQVTISPSDRSSASDPDIFYDGTRYVLYISRGANVQVYTSPTLHGSYTLSTSLPDGYLVRGGGVPAGHFDPTTARCWTYVHTPDGIIRRAVHASLDTPLSQSDFTTVLTGSSIGLGSSYRVESPGFAVNTSADGGSPTATPTPSADQCVRDVNANGQGDIVDVEATAAVPGCLVYLPQVVRNWRQPWPATTPTPSPTPTTTPGASDLTFVPDPGFRVEDASNPAPSVDPETGTVYLFYEDRSANPPRRMVATSSDGLTFSAGRPPTDQDNPHHPFHVRLPNGTWRKYLFDPAAAALKSESSSDGIYYAPDPGVRYTLHSSDNGTAGVHDEYVDPAGGVVLLYIGDMQGVNNVRRAYSPPGDNGWTFTFEDGNVLGDAGAGGGGNSYVDPKSILLPDGRRRLFTMSQGPLPPLPGQRTVGKIFSFISDDGKNYTLEPGVRLQPEGFTGFQVWSLNDPVVVRLLDARYRMYVAALVTDGSGGNRWVIVSATTPQGG